ncbi:GlxA family transcriptional regulator [Polyangium aurulentum]|uniref:GlxA family transcriptional regulator n=1 Tax=Polyangium aurulentum TaxID=2567896 RepID=UPI0010AEA0DA|nr:AraC family transcriptional regulator [Polyangium aurulentum]UQA55516.1 AraC family transcriptional regulator [Polyangium aurulentum]
MPSEFTKNASRSAAGAARRRVAILAFPDMVLLDAAGPIEVFSVATSRAREKGADAAGYTVELLAPKAGPIRTSSSVRLHADRSLAEAADDDIDTLIVPGGIAIEALFGDAALLSWLKTMATRVRRLCAVCNGSVLLAEAGLLDGRRAVTHWNYCSRLSRRYPRVRVEPDALFVRDGHIWTSGGVTAGMDLSLALVEEDLGRDLTLAIARDLVMYVKRAGGQSQFSAELAAQATDEGPISLAQRFILDNPGEDLSVEALARRFAMSPRHFARVFVRDAGTTPGEFIERARVDAARRALTQGASSLDMVARQCGLGDADNMRRIFLRRLGVTPRDYRARFAPPAPLTAPSSTLNH